MRWLCKRGQYFIAPPSIAASIIITIAYTMYQCIHTTITLKHLLRLRRSTSNRLIFSRPNKMTNDNNRFYFDYLSHIDFIDIDIGGWREIAIQSLAIVRSFFRKGTNKSLLKNKYNFKSTYILLVLGCLCLCKFCFFISNNILVSGWFVWKLWLANMWWAVASTKFSVIYDPAGQALDSILPW